MKWERGGSFFPGRVRGSRGWAVAGGWGHVGYEPRFSGLNPPLLTFQGRGYFPPEGGENHVGIADFKTFNLGMSFLFSKWGKSRNECVDKGKKPKKETKGWPQWVTYS